jgi:prepilin-type N-terminal cleavage/methylation domain-containing protein
MIFFLKNFKTNYYKLKAKSYKLDKGMTYVELIVVLSIFSVMTSIVMFNYSDFQDKVDIKILANDIASKIVEAQKSAMSGALQGITPAGWKPSYGVSFNSSIDPDPEGIAFNKRFVYFANFDNNDIFSDPSDSVLDKILITKNNYIKDIKCLGVSVVGDLDIVFRRPNSGALISCSSEVEITISSPGDKFSAIITISPSGRIKIN